MIDRYLAFVGQRTRPTIDKHSAPISPAKEHFSHIDGNRRLTVVFGFWNAPVRSLLQTAKSLEAKSSDVLLFDLNPDILYQQPAHVRKSFEILSKGAIARVSDLVDEYPYTSIDLLGFSLGNVPLCMTARQLQSFHSATMVVPGSDIAICLWEGARTQRLREAFVLDDITLETLQKEWQILAPASHAKAFRNHHVTVYLSKGDRFIPYKYGLEFVAALENAGVKPAVKTSRIVGHALTINNYIRSLK